MKRKIIIASAVIAVCLAVLFLILWPKPLKISEEEALSVLKDLVPKSYEINVIFFGEGLLAVDEAYEEEHSSTSYFEVAEGYNYDSIEDIKKEAEKIYSSNYLEDVYVSAFEGDYSETSDGKTDLTVSPRYKDIGGKLMVDVSVKGKDIRNKLEVISSKIEKRTSKYVKLSTVCKENGNTIEVDMFLTLENGNWRLAGPTY